MTTESIHHQIPRVKGKLWEASKASPFLLWAQCKMCAVMESTRFSSLLQHTHSPLPWILPLLSLPTSYMESPAGPVRVWTGLLSPILTSLPFQLRSDKYITQKEILRITLLSLPLCLGSGNSLGFCMTFFQACILHWDADRQPENTKCSLPCKGAF